MPLTPNEDTAARRGRPTLGHSMGSDAIVKRDRALTGLRGQPLEVELFGDVPVVHAQHGLDEARDACSRLQMTQIRLHRTQHQGRGALRSE